MIRSLFLLFTILIPFSALAGENVRFSLPLDCDLNEDCWIAQYVDVNTDKDKHQDFMCTSKTYEGHKGTDFAVRSRIEMAVGVDVLAAADGTVLRIRDGENDAVKSDEQYIAIRAANKDCGNGVILEHGDGWQSFYCHLKNGSLRVKPKDKVKTGQIIGQIGQSGFAEFPHLHFTVISDGQHIDPFTGLAIGAGCQNSGQSLWNDQINYEPFTVFDGGFEAGAPDFKTIKNGYMNPQFLSKDIEAFTYWVGFFHGQAGDTLTMKVLEPDGDIFVRRDITLEKNRARNFYYTGRKLKGRTLEAGLYKGQVTFKRENVPSKTYTHEIVIK